MRAKKEMQERRRRRGFEDNGRLVRKGDICGKEGKEGREIDEGNERKEGDLRAMEGKEGMEMRAMKI